MAFDFPSSPTVGQQFSPVAGTTYTYNGYAWALSVVLGAGQLKKNYIINGAMRISQENGATAVNPISALPYPVDMFGVNSGTTGTATVAQVASLTPGGSPNRLRYTVTAADAAVAAGDLVQIIYFIEGLNAADLKIGTAVARQITLQFGVKAPAGTYGVSFHNSAFDRSYVAQYIISAGEANTDVVKSITLTLDTAGTWLSDNGGGLDIRWFLMGGSDFQTATPNTWLASSFYCTASQFNIMGTNGNVFELFDVGLYEGPVAPPFQVPDYASELQLCRRYYQTDNVTSDWISAAATENSSFAVTFAPVMRASPTMSLQAGATTSNVGSTAFYSTTANGTYFQVFSATAARTFYYGIAIANARL